MERTRMVLVTLTLAALLLALTTEYWARRELEQQLQHQQQRLLVLEASLEDFTQQRTREREQIGVAATRLLEAYNELVQDVHILKEQAKTTNRRLSGKD